MIEYISHVYMNSLNTHTSIHSFIYSIPICFSRNYFFYQRVKVLIFQYCFFHQSSKCINIAISNVHDVGKPLQNQCTYRTQIVSPTLPEVGPISVKKNSPFLAAVFLTAIFINSLKEPFTDTQNSLLCLFWGICCPLLRQCIAIEITVKNEKPITFN